MTTMQLNAELFRSLSVIADDEGLMKRATSYLRKLAARKEAAVDDTLMSRKEFFAQVDKGLAEIKRGEGICFTNKDDMNAWLNTL